MRLAAVAIYLAAAAPFAAHAECVAAPCLAPSVHQAEALFGRIEQVYPMLFSPAATTQAMQSGGDTAIYRTYANDLATGLGTFQGGLWYAIGGAWVRYSSLDEGDRQFCNGACWGAAPTTAAFSIVLGSPSASSIKANVLSPDQTGLVSLLYGTLSGAHTMQTAAAASVPGKPVVLTMDGLSADTRYFYRLQFQPSGGGTASTSEEYAFRTARPVGSTFIFTVQADSHLDENSDLDTYRRTLANVLADTPDFHIDLGDTFMCEKYSGPLTATQTMAPDQATVNARYVYERANFGLVSHSAPLFLVNGNHEGELGWLANGTAQNLAVWTSQARQQYFQNPVPDSFYSGDTLNEPFVGERASWYAWQWGDALFIVLDPYWNTKTKTNTDGWVYTLGERQYKWLESTLSMSAAKFKFVFLHNLVGGLDGQMRGGVEAAPYFEWGGRNLDGTMAFAQKRPGWSLPIHALLVRHGVTAVFHGHDHLYAKQELDGIVYQEVPQPSARNFQSGAVLATEYHYGVGTILSSSGHLRVTVNPSQVTAQYVRAWLPKQETAQRKNGQVDHAWSVATQ